MFYKNEQRTWGPESKKSIRTLPDVLFFSLPGRTGIESRLQNALPIRSHQNVLAQSRKDETLHFRSQVIRSTKPDSKESIANQASALLRLTNFWLKHGINLLTLFNRSILRELRLDILWTVNTEYVDSLRRRQIRTYQVWIMGTVTKLTSIHDRPSVHCFEWRIGYVETATAVSVY